MTAYPSRVHVISTLCYVGNYLMFWLYFYFSSSQRLHINVRRAKEKADTWQRFQQHQVWNICCLSAVALTLLSCSAENGREEVQQDRQADGETERKRETERERERKNVCVGARVQYKVSWGLFSWLSRSVSPPSTSPVTHARTHTHSSLLFKSRYISQEIEAFGKVSLVPLGYSQTSARVTPPPSRAQFLSVRLSLLRQTPLSSKTLHNHPQST